MSCAALSVSPSGYYAWRSRPDSSRKIANRALLVDIRRVHAQHRERHGAPRIHAELRAAGQTVSRKRVERVMRQHGLRARAARRYRVCTTDSKHCLPVADFVAHRPDQVWLADITYIPTSEGWLYLAVVFDRSLARWLAGPCASTCVPNSPSSRSSWQSNAACAPSSQLLLQSVATTI